MCEGGVACGSARALESAMACERPAAPRQPLQRRVSGQAWGGGGQRAGEGGAWHWFASKTLWRGPLDRLQGAARTFHAFDAQRTGRITLDFSQFVYAASNVM